MAALTSVLNTLASLPKQLAASLQGLKLPAPAGLAGNAITQMASGEFWVGLTERSVATKILYAGTTAYGSLAVGAAGEFGEALRNTVFPQRKGHRGGGGGGGGFDPNIHGNH
ncbi:MAG: hypothetical protein IT292_03110 [Deltaproteobacteria bacterium]|nr:hypothetical protein [Deltaproteobacteria bacterium]